MIHVRRLCFQLHCPEAQSVCHHVCVAVCATFRSTPVTNDRHLCPAGLSIAMPGNPRVQTLRWEKTGCFSSPDTNPSSKAGGTHGTRYQNTTGREVPPGSATVLKPSRGCFGVWQGNCNKKNHGFKFVMALSSPVTTIWCSICAGLVLTWPWLSPRSACPLRSYHHRLCRNHCPPRGLGRDLQFDLDLQAGSWPGRR